MINKKRFNKTPSEISRKLTTWHHVASEIMDGLNGKPFSWNGGEFSSYRDRARSMGITLVTKTQVAKIGRRLKRGAKPVGKGYFSSPISRHADLYVLECQTREIKGKGEKND